MSGDLLIRDTIVAGRDRQDVRIRAGRIVEIGERLSGREPVLAGEGGWLVPGLIDHHIHLLAWAARRRSVRLDGLDEPGVAKALRAAPGQGWIRAVGHHGQALDRDRLDRLVPDRPLRVQSTTGGLWTLNSAALKRVLDGEPPPCVECDPTGRPTGRIWRGDAWLRGRIAQEPPSLAEVGQALAEWGVTGVTDASATTGPAEAALLAQAVLDAVLPQRLMLMSAGPLPEHPAYVVGPVKLLLDEHDLPDWDDLAGRFAAARAQGRAIAVHCVTATELAFTLAAFEAFGARPGDRIEHGSVIPPSALPVLAQLGLTVVTQPAFVAERGDRYRAEVEAADQPDLYRCASLVAAGVRVAASSDAPYAEADPWAAIRAATRRTTAVGHPLGLEERLSPSRALGLFLGAFDDPGGPPRRVAVGALADLCLLSAPPAQAAFVERPVAATVIAGRVAWSALEAPAHVAA
jgi:predicted amidohydrolase YtcJ